MVAHGNAVGAVFPYAAVDQYGSVRVPLSHHLAHRPPVWRAWPGGGCGRRGSYRAATGLLVHGSVPGVGLLRSRICPDARDIWGICPVGDRWTRNDAVDRRACRGRSAGAPSVETSLI